MRESSSTSRSRMVVSYGKLFVREEAQTSAGCSGQSGRSGNSDRVGLRPGFLALLEFDFVHGDGQAIVIHLCEQVVIVDAGVLVEIVGGAGNRIGMSTAAAGDKVGDAVVCMALVVVDVAVENDDSRAQEFLPSLQELAESLFQLTSRVAASELLLVGRTGIDRVMENQEDEVHGGRQLIQLGTQPVALRA